MDTQSIKRASHIPTCLVPHVSPCATPLESSSLINTMIQLKQGNNPKHSATISSFTFKSGQ